MMIEIISNLQIDKYIDYLGAFAFCVSGASLALMRRMDEFGIFVLSVVSGFGGGMMRDIILGNTPPVAFRTPAYWLIALFATIVILIPDHFIQRKIKLKLSKKVIYFFDSLGLAFYTIVGIKAGLEKSLISYQCIIMGVLTSCFGGVLRDIIVNRVPYLFHRDIYALLSILGGILFFLLQPLIKSPYLELFVIGIIFIARLLVIKFDLHLPKQKINSPRFELAKKKK